MTIFTFYKQNNNKEYIHIMAMSYLKAVGALNEINNYASYVYNLKEYKNELITMDNKDLSKLLNIDEFYLMLPYILSDKQYKLIKSKYVYSKSYIISKVVKDNTEVDKISDPLIQKIQKIVDHPKYNTFIPTNNCY